MLNQHDYHQISHLVFRDGYAGYKPTVKEIPNGDGKVDAEKRYAHVATKYLRPDTPGRHILLHYLHLAHELATEIARRIEVPEEFMPCMETSALRILYYPPGAVSNPHEDFDLFTLMLYRDQPEKFVAEASHTYVGSMATYDTMQLLNKGAHVGQMGAEVGLGPATPHEVVASAEPQHSMVYFTIPRWEAVLPRACW